MIERMARLARENERLRAENEELTRTVHMLQTEYVRQNPCTDPQDEIDELERETARLRAVNAGLVEALRYVKNSMETDQMLEGIDFGNELYVMNEALSRAEQAKPEVEK